MRKNLKSALAASVVIGALAGGSVFYAQAADQQKPPAQGAMTGGMMQGGHGDMMDMTNMMQQMNQMMEGCNAMMKEMNTQPAPGAPKDQKKPGHSG